MLSGEPSLLRYVPTTASGQLALGVYRRNDQAGLPVCLDVLAVKHGRISEVVAFRSLEDCSRFGLPESLPLDDPDYARDH